MPDLGSTSPLVFCLLAIVIAAVGSLLPVSPAEPMLVALAAAAPPTLLVPLALLASAASMGAKTAVYFGARWAPHALPASKRAWVERTSARLGDRRAGQCLLLFASSTLGVPPFYVVTAAYGTLRLPLGDFLVAGGLGRALRFGALMGIPQLVAALR